SRRGFPHVVLFQTYTLLPPSLTTGTQLNPRYVLVNQYMTWPNAQRFCRENFTDLATVRNDAENQAVTSVAQKAAWIGLFRGPNFYWSDESSFLFTNWQSGENQISSTTDMCGVTSLQNSGQWKFSSCETKLPFVCYKPAGECFTALH
uniref:C-type lectin domain-containing protein n=1 Tax=Kryptolebias marmoratus TaxID=37003 RepID=A0A3Q3GHJ7_KRYMA